MTRRRWPCSDSSRPVVVGTSSGLVVTLFVTINPLARFAYDNSSLHVALETAEGLIAALLAYLAIERFRARKLRRDALLAWTFAVLSATNLLLSAGPLVVHGARPVGGLLWAVAGFRLLGAAGLCAAAVLPEAAFARRPVAKAVGWISCAAVLSIVLAAGAAELWLADAIDPTLSPESSRRPHLGAHPVVLGVQLLGMALYGAAAVGFQRQARRVHDELVPWLAAGAVVSAFARLNFFLFPSLYTNWVYVGDILRLGSYLCFLIGAAKQIDVYRHHETRVAVLEERRHMARELHDGLVQELAFIRSQTASMAVIPASTVTGSHVAAAAERAMRESRRLIEVFADDDERPLRDALHHAAEDVALRAGVKVEVRVGDVADVSADVRGSLVRVVREAVSNTVRHAEATAVTVDVRAEGERLRVTVGDDGRGFETNLPSKGFGLRSMRDRVEALGGTFAVHSGPEQGTLVEVMVPLDPDGQRSGRQGGMSGARVFRGSRP